MCTQDLVMWPACLNCTKMVGCDWVIRMRCRVERCKRLESYHSWYTTCSVGITSIRSVSAMRSFGAVYRAVWVWCQFWKQYGDRIPAVWVNREKFFHITSAVSGNLNFSQDVDYTLNQWYHFEIIQEENSKGEVIYSIFKDKVAVVQVVNTLPQRFEKVILYTSDPFYPSFAPFGELKNLKIVNLG